MNFTFKTIAVAAAMAAASAAHADLIDASSGNSSFALVAFNTVTKSYYVRDLGYALNDFMPNSVTTSADDAVTTATGDVGDKTPNAGLNITWAAGQFTSWLGSQTLSQIKWTVAAGDSQNAGGLTDQSRALVAFTTVPGTAPSNLSIRNAVSSAAGVTGLASTNNDGSNWYDKTGTTIFNDITTNNGFGVATLNALDVAAKLFYFSTTTSSGSNATTAFKADFANSSKTATLTLGSNGVLTYNLDAGGAGPAAVPLPASVWLLGAGLAGIGGFIRRRKAAAQA